MSAEDTRGQGNTLAVKSIPKIGKFLRLSTPAESSQDLPSHQRYGTAAILFDDGEVWIKRAQKWRGDDENVYHQTESEVVSEADLAEFTEAIEEFTKNTDVFDNAIINAG